MDWVISDFLPLNSPDTPSLLLTRCFWTWALIIFQFHQLSLFLCSSAPIYDPLPIIFRKLFRLSLFSLRLSQFFCRKILSLNFSGTESGQFSLSFGHVKLYPQAWWSPEVEDVVSKRENTFAAAYGSDDDRLGYIFAFPRLRHGRRHAHHSLLNLCVLSSIGFRLCRLPEIPLSVFQPKTLHSIASGYLSEIRRATYPEESSFIFYPPLNFLQLPQIFFCLLPLAETKLPIPC